MKIPFKFSYRLLPAVLSLTLLTSLSSFAQKQKKGDTAAQSASAQTSGPVDLNSASEKDLNALPGVGPATARKIVAGRPYSSVDDLSKAGVSKSTIEKIRGQVTVSGSAATTPAATTPAGASTSASTSSSRRSSAKADKAEATTAASSGPVDLNSASEKDLNALPGVGPATSRKIIAGRPYASVDDLAKAGVSKSTIEKIRGQVTVAGGASAAKNPAPAAPPATTAATTPQPSQPAPPATAAKGSMRPEERQSTSSRGAPQSDVAPPPAGSGMVWVNLDTKVYHREGDRWYGKTKNGKYMTESDAQAAGYRPSKQK